MAGVEFADAGTASQLLPQASRLFLLVAVSGADWTFGVTLLLWGYKYLCKHTLAVVSETGIKIDHCQILRWDDIVSAEYRQARCCFRRLPIIILRPRQGLKYHYNYLQKRCAKMDFTAFSIPLYDITKEDSRILQQIIAEQVGVIRK